MTRPVALTVLSLACLGAALWWPLHPAAWPLLAAAVAAGACAAVGFVGLADPPEHTPRTEGGLSMGRHNVHRPHHPTLPVRIGAVAILAAATATTWWATTATPDADARPATPIVVQGVPLTAPERIYLAELAEAGIDLNPTEKPVAVAIAREHVSHGHLIGMREIIRMDFRTDLPRLTDTQVETAKTAVEHHFLAVTGRKQ